MSRGARRKPAPAPAPRVNPAESPLGWLRSRKDRSGEAMITESEFLAGERLREDYTIAGLMPRVTMSWDGFGSRVDARRGTAGGGLVITEAAMAAQARVRAALAAVGPDLAGVLVDVCCHLHGIADIERRNDWPSRSGKVVLRLGLSALARHYGIDGQATGPDKGRIRRWGTADSRPRITP